MAISKGFLDHRRNIEGVEDIHLQTLQLAPPHLISPNGHWVINTVSGYTVMPLSVRLSDGHI
jgi:hypothetical protein